MAPPPSTFASRVDHAQPLLLIRSDMAHLLTPIEPVQLGTRGGPLQSTPSLAGHFKVTASNQQCMFTTTVLLTSELFKNVKCLWQIDTLPYTSEKQVT